MTLSTEVYVKDRIDRRELFVKCNQLIGAHENVRFTEKDRGINNDPDQGLCAWLMLDANADGTPVSPVGAEHGRWCDGPDDTCYHGDEDEGDCRDEPCFARVDFDTAYGYRGDNGEGCGDLHARIVAELGAWLDSKGIDWSWRNEFTGEVHHRYEGLTGLASGGAEATDWFRNIAAPAIAAHIAAGGTR